MGVLKLIPKLVGYDKSSYKQVCIATFILFPLIVIIGEDLISNIPGDVIIGKLSKINCFVNGTIPV